MMTTIEQQVAQHYSHGALEGVITNGLEKLSETSQASSVELLASVDEFHIGGRPATKAMTEQLCLHSDHSVLDIGCGLGGTARHIATDYGCSVSGVDLTPEYIEVGNTLNQRLGLEGKIDLAVASALNMPYEDAVFERATMIHVGMNIDDKSALFAEIHRVMQADGLLGIYDVMRMDSAPLTYPVAWASGEATSFVATIQEYRDALEANGFEILDEEIKRQLALDFFQAIKDRLANGGPPPLGLHIVMGQQAPVKVANMNTNVQKGLIAPVQILARRK